MGGKKVILKKKTCRSNQRAGLVKRSLGAGQNWLTVLWEWTGLEWVGLGLKQQSEPTENKTMKKKGKKINIVEGMQDFK